MEGDGFVLVYTLTLINQQVRTNEPEVHVFTTIEAAKSFAFTWMYIESGLAPRSQFTMSYQEMNDYCAENDICVVDIKSHTIHLPKSKFTLKVQLDERGEQFIIVQNRTHSA